MSNERKNILSVDPGQASRAILRTVCKYSTVSQDGLGETGSGSRWVSYYGPGSLFGVQLGLIALGARIPFVGRK